MAKKNRKSAPSIPSKQAPAKIPCFEDVNTECHKKLMMLDKMFIKRGEELIESYTQLYTLKIELDKIRTVTKNSVNNASTQTDNIVDNPSSQNEIYDSNIVEDPFVSSTLTSDKNQCILSSCECIDSTTDHNIKNFSTPTKNSDYNNSNCTISTQTFSSRKKRKSNRKTNRQKCPACDEQGHNVSECPYVLRTPIRKLQFKQNALNSSQVSETPVRTPKRQFSSSFSTPRRIVHPSPRISKCYSAPHFRSVPSYSQFPVMQQYFPQTVPPFPFIPPPFWNMPPPFVHGFTNFYATPPKLKKKNLVCQMCDTVGHTAKRCFKLRHKDKPPEVDNLSRPSSSQQ